MPGIETYNLYEPSEGAWGDCCLLHSMPLSTWGTEVNDRYPPQQLATLVFDIGAHCTSSSTIRLASKPRGSSCFLLAEVTGAHGHTWPLNGSGDPNADPHLMLVWQILYLLGCLLSTCTLTNIHVCMHTQKNIIKQRQNCIRHHLRLIVKISHLAVACLPNIPNNGFRNSLACDSCSVLIKTSCDCYHFRT